MSDLFWLTDEQMERLRPFFPKSHGKPRVDDRRVLSGIVVVNKNGLRWRDAPSAYGPYKTLYNRWKRWGVTVPSLGFLARHAFCAPCREVGATGRANLEFQCAPVEDKSAVRTNWSRAQVFTNDRRDPTPNLPHRSIFDRRLHKLERMR